MLGKAFVAHLDRPFAYAGLDCLENVTEPVDHAVEHVRNFIIIDGVQFACRSDGDQPEPAGAYSTPAARSDAPAPISSARAGPLDAGSSNSRWKFTLLSAKKTKHQKSDCK